jgi:GH35 family endo-1,4-beta-xylanase
MYRMTVFLLLCITLLSVVGCKDDVVLEVQEVQEVLEVQEVEEVQEIEMIEEITEEITEVSVDTLKDFYKEDFLIGVALSRDDILNQEKAQLVIEQFNSITCENEMKPDFLLDRQETLARGEEDFAVVNMKNALIHLNFAKENNIFMRGHTLVWHSQTPRWFFTEGFDNAADAPYVSREVMLLRMENYIKQVILFVDDEYPGVLVAWDVVNEAIELGNGHPKGIRMVNNPWFDVIGEDYVEQAFIFARKYAPKDQKLFYNDYGTYDIQKLHKIRELLEPLVAQGLVDGIGMQDHMQLDNPNILDYQYTINKYAESGLEIQVTEFDINVRENDEESQIKLATKYKNMMSTLLSQKRKARSPITSVTFWGLTDNRSWLNNEDGPSYPLLFDENLKPKPAFFGVLQDDAIPRN